MTVLFEGDPRLFLDENGSSLKFVGGQPVMDGGLENAVLISLFTKQGWIGNTVFPDAAVHIGSDYENSFRKVITITAILDIKQAAERALQWLIDVGVASEITVVVANIESYSIRTTITIKPPMLPAFDLILTRNGTNWIIQKNNPAYVRG